MEQFLVQGLVPVPGAHVEEDVAADGLVHDLAVGGGRAEGDVFLLEAHLHLFDLPVHAPRLHAGEAPRLVGVSRAQLHPDHPVRRDAQQLLSPNKKHRVYH